MKSFSKTLPLLLTSLALTVATASAQSIETSLKNPGEFRDFSVNGLNEEKSARILKAELADVLPRVAGRYLPEDNTLHITFTDIDMAGEIQPWRNIHNADIRYVEQIYPPRLQFSYSLVNDQTGETIAEGEDKISDMAFQMNAGASIRMRHQSFFYETELLSDWIRQTFRDLKKPDSPS
jgi:hypothetical protein